MPRKRDTIPRPDVFRQSLLASAETCMRRTRFDLQTPDDLTVGWTESSADLGTVGHAVFAAILEALKNPEWGEVKDDGSKSISTQEGVEIMYEVTQSARVVLSYKDQQDLLGMVLGFCAYRFRPHAIFTIEQELRLPLVCDDGQVRILKGQPDLISGDPPNGLAIEDFKTGMARPRKPDDKDLILDVDGIEVVVGRKYLSDRGHFQGDTYGLLALEGFLSDGTQIAPSSTHVRFIERNLRWNTQREATLTRDDLEHVRRRLGTTMMLLDQAISEGPRSDLWKPRPGKHCARQCPVAQSCPVPRGMRGDGGIATQPQADAAARRAAVMGAKKDQAILQLKAWQEQGNAPGMVNDREEYRWGPDADAWTRKGGGRTFKVWPAVNSNGNGGA